MDGLERAGTLKSGHFAELGKDHHLDEQLDENNQLYSHIELLSLQMTEQALESSGNVTVRKQLIYSITKQVITFLSIKIFLDFRIRFLTEPLLTVSS